MTLSMEKQKYPKTAEFSKETERKKSRVDSPQLS